MACRPTPILNPGPCAMSRTVAAGFAWHHTLYRGSQPHVALTCVTTWHIRRAGVPPNSAAEGDHGHRHGPCGRGSGVWNRLVPLGGTPGGSTPTPHFLVLVHPPATERSGGASGALQVRGGSLRLYGELVVEWVTHRMIGYRHHRRYYPYSTWGAVPAVQRGGGGGGDCGTSIIQKVGISL